MESTYIYVLKDPQTNAVRYVGKSINPKQRFMRHRSAIGTGHTVNWIKQLQTNGLVPIMEIVDSVVGAWQIKEQWWIKMYSLLGANLTNHTLGGEGQPGCRPTLETRQKRASSMKAVWADPIRGEKVRHGRSRIPTPPKLIENLTRRNKSIEQRQAVSRALRDRKLTAQQLSARPQNRPGSTRSAQAKENMRQGRKARQARIVCNDAIAG